MNRRTFCFSSALALSLVDIGTILADAQPGDPMTGDDPMLAAEYLSRLEVEEYIPALYTLYEHIHPDAAEIVPRGTVIGWYQADFQPLGPKPAVATGVNWLDSWTWEVTGKSYADVAEVSFVQEFEHSDTLQDVVRLVFHDGSWRWWFGRDAAWVEEQKSRFSLIENTPQAGDAPFGLGALPHLNATTLQLLPLNIDDQGNTFELAETAMSSYDDGIRQPQHALQYRPASFKSEFGLGTIEFGNVVDSTSSSADLIRIADRAQNGPPVIFTGWNSAPSSGPAWLQVESPGVDVVGTSYAMYLVMDGNYLQIRMFSEESLQIVCEALTP